MKLDLEVVKSDGSQEEFNLHKIHKSLLKACEKRPVTLEQIEETIDKILTDLKNVEVTIIPTTTVGKIVLKNLKELDEIAFLKFAIVHNNYGSIRDFMKEINKLKDFKGLDYKPLKKTIAEQAE